MALSRYMFILKQTLGKPVNAPVTIALRNYKRWFGPTLRELQRRKDKMGPQEPSPRSSYLEWNFNAELFAFSKRLGENFNYDLLKQALTHKSYLEKKSLEETPQEEEQIEHDNEEFIKSGEIIIDNEIKKCLEKKYPEIVAKSLHAYLTTPEHLAYVGNHLGLTDLVFTEEYPVTNENMAKTVKAIIAALEKSSGIEKANKFVDDFILTKLTDYDVFDIWEPEEPYKYLTQELLSNKKIEPRLCNQSASNTILANFQVGLYGENKELLGIGWGESVDIAKNTAALDAIRKIYRI